jgi:hypothetical protein
MISMSSSLVSIKFYPSYVEATFIGCIPLRLPHFLSPSEAVIKVLVVGLDCIFLLIFLCLVMFSIVVVICIHIIKDNT